MNELITFKENNLELSISVVNESIWISQRQMAELFEVNVATINEHLKNIYKDKELQKDSTIRNFLIVQKEGKRDVKRQIEHYNLDAILSVGYRVNSKKATKFRIWATKILKDYLIKGYALNKDKLKEQKLDELTQTLNLFKDSFMLSNEAKGFITIISNYAKSWALLQGYDEESLQDITQTKEQKFILDYKEALNAIAEFKKELIKKGEASELFGVQKANELEGNLLNIYQTFGGVELLPSIEQKAANLLYYIVKGHPFNDGNKRIGAYLFILFLSKNQALYKANGELKINDNALASLTLLVATSLPAQKDLIIKLIMNILYDA